MREIIKRALGSSFIKNTMKLSASNVILTLLPLIVTPILSRLYTPEDYAGWGVFSSVLFIVNSFLCLSYENAIIRTNKREEVPNLVALCLLVALFVIFLTGIVFIAGRLLHIKFFNEFPSIILLLATLLVTVIHSIFLCVVNREKNYTLMSVVNVSNGLTQALVRILLGVFPIISLGLIWGNLFGHVVAALILIVFITRELTNISLNVSVDGIKEVAKKYQKFPKYDAPAKFVEFTVANVVIIILSHFFAKSEVGCYSMCMQFILLPITVIGSAIGNVYYREISEQNEKSQVRNSTIKVAKMNLLLSILPILFLTLGGDSLLVLFLGSKWENAGTMAIIMSIFSLPVILSEPLLPAFRALDKQEYRLRLNVINLVFSIGSLITASLFFDKIYIVLLIYSIIYSIIRFIFFFTVLKLTDVSIINVTKWFVPIIVSVYALVAARFFILGFN